jgi:hypothetical protein
LERRIEDFLLRLGVIFRRSTWSLCQTYKSIDVIGFYWMNVKSLTSIPETRIPPSDQRRFTYIDRTILVRLILKEGKIIGVATL